MVSGTLSQGGGQFETAFRSYLHARLRTTTLVLAVTTFGLLLTSLVAHLNSRVASPDGLFNTTRVTLLAGLAVAAGFFFLLRRPRLSARVLVLVDTVLLWSIVAACVTYYALAYREGPFILIPVLGLLLLARAILIPSRGLRTLLLSLPAAPAVLIVQLVYHEFHLVGGDLYPQEWFVHLVIWNQAWLLLAIGLAVVASRLNFALRMEVHEAETLGQYQLETLIGEGGMGRVYRARHALLMRPTAVKVIRGDLVSERSLRRFEEEVRQTSRLTHPNTVAIYDYGRTGDGIFFYAMEYLEGADLAKIVEGTGPMPAARVIHVLAQAADALQEAHAMGLVHRDVKPGNFFLCGRGPLRDVLKVMDFGLVKDVQVDSGLTAMGEICGTPETLSPEAILGKPVTAASDIYALGAVGCFLLTGRSVFDVDTPIAFVNCHLREKPIPPSARGLDVPADLEEALLACLAKDPGERPPSASDLRERLLACRDAGGWSRSEAEDWWDSNGPRLDTNGDERPDAVTR